MLPSPKSLACLKIENSPTSIKSAFESSLGSTLYRNWLEEKQKLAKAAGRCPHSVPHHSLLRVRTRLPNLLIQDLEPQELLSPRQVSPLSKRLGPPNSAEREADSVRSCVGWGPERSSWSGFDRSSRRGKPRNVPKTMERAQEKP